MRDDLVGAGREIAVSILPGAIALTRTPSRPKSDSATCPISTAPFAAASARRPRTCARKRGGLSGSFDQANIQS
jgi:hypothetical protein